MTKRTDRAVEYLPDKLLREAHRRGYADLLLQRRLIVALSGGADSLALLYALLALRGAGATESLHVAHLEHGFRGAEGEADAQFVFDVAREHGLDCAIRHVDVPALAASLRLSPEDAARRARYSFLAALARKEDAALAVAHTADDQAETVLLAILRGSGLAGIAGMQPLAEMRFPPPIEGTDDSQEPTAAVQVFRPLLSIWRGEVEEYCRELGLTPRTDSTNAEQTYLRNRLRLDLLPSLQAGYSPTIKEHLANLAEIASDEESLLDRYADDIWPDVGSYSQEGALYVDTSRFALLHVAMQRRLVRRAIAEVACTLDGLSFRHVSSVVGAFTGGSENVPSFHLPHGVAVEVVAGRGTITRYRAKHKPTSEYSPSSRTWPLMSGEVEIKLAAQTLTLERGWLLESSITSTGEPQTTPGDLEAHFDLPALSELGPLVLRPRRPGDTIQPLGMAGRKSLQDLFVDAKIPRALRDHIPVLARAGTNDVLWVPGRGGRRSALAPSRQGTTQLFKMAFTMRL